MKKKLALLISAFVMLVLTLTGCAPAGGGATKKIEFSDSYVRIEIFGEKEVTAWTSNFEGDITWENSDPTCVLMEETSTGIKLLGLKEGSATIKATSGDIEAVLPVTILSNNGEQIVFTTQLDREENFLVGDKLNLQSKAYYKGVEFTKGQIVYEFDKDGIVSIENGVLTALAEGEVTITAYATYNGVTSNKLMFKINVYPATFIKTSVKEITLDIAHPLNTNTSNPTSFEVPLQFVVNGQEVSSATFIGVSTNESVAKFNNGVITSYLGGKTTITIYCDYEEVRYSVDIIVNVNSLPDNITNLYEDDVYDDSSWIAKSEEDPWMKDPYNKN